MLPLMNSGNLRPNAALELTALPGRAAPCIPGSHKTLATAFAQGQNGSMNFYQQLSKRLALAELFLRPEIPKHNRAG